MEIFEIRSVSFANNKTAQPYWLSGLIWLRR